MTPNSGELMALPLPYLEVYDAHMHVYKNFYKYIQKIQKNV